MSLGFQIEVAALSAAGLLLKWWGDGFLMDDEGGSRNSREGEGRVDESERVG